jgi:glycosyltransferase involved in cell wall biosynthesis
MPFDENKVRQRPPRIYAAVALPPPLNGMTNVSKKMLDLLSADGGVIRPKVLPSWLWPGWRHIGFAQHILQGSGKLYFVPDAGRGLHLNALEARLMKRYQHILLHHHVFSYLNAYDVRFARFLNALPCRVSHIMLSQNMKRSFHRLYGRQDDVYVLGNSPFVQKPEIVDRRTRVKRLGFLSNITTQKGIEEVIETARTITEIEIDIAGPATPDVQKMISRFVEEAPLKRRWLGAVYGSDKEQFFRDIDVLLFPTRYPNEAQPLVIFEALAAGIPVLATPRGCIPEQLDAPDWILSPESFACEAARLISRWIHHPASYANAVFHAKSVFDRHLEQDSRTLRDIVNRFGV